jgi:ubiquinone/menaquinone biosynthesis C-methylase UbiE
MRGNSILIEEQQYSENIYQQKWQPQAINRKEFERKYSVSLRDHGNNLRFRAYKAQFGFLLQSQGIRFLDCACGAGHLSIWLAMAGKRVWAFDFSKSAISIARESAKQSGVAQRITFSTMDARHLDYEDGYFDVVTGKDCIHHLIKYPEAITEIARVLKPGGKAVFVEPLALNPVVNLLRFINVRYHKRVGERMLTKGDLKFLESSFGSLRMDHFSVFSTFSKLIARKPDQVVGIRRKICMILDSFDVFMCKVFPYLKRYSSVCYIKLTKL